MYTYALMVENVYVGFGLAEDVAAETEGYDPNIVTVVTIASADEFTARNLVDYFTNAKDRPVTLEEFQLVNAEFVLTPAGQALWDRYNS